MKLLQLCLCTTLTLGLNACEDKSPAEKAETSIEKVGDSVDKAKETVKEAVDKTEKAMEKAKESVKETANDTRRAIEDAKD